MNEEKTVDGYDIPLRELTNEEASRAVTVDRIQKYYYAAGESFIDTHESIIDAKLFAGWLACENKQLALQIWKCSNEGGKYGPCLNSLMNIMEEKYGHWDGDNDTTGWYKFYQAFSNFVNTTVITKKRVNQVLIQICEYYK